jgi:hypothetical protein
VPAGFSDKFCPLIHKLNQLVSLESKSPEGLLVEVPILLIEQKRKFGLLVLIYDWKSKVLKDRFTAIMLKEQIIEAEKCVLITAVTHQLTDSSSPVVYSHD